MAERIPVTLLTGFLGSGKTTLVNALLVDPALADTAVIVNEFGAIALDHLLVSSADDNVVLLGNGCLCCTAQSGLRETLADLFVRRVKGTVPKFRRVLVETTGLADPGPVANVLDADALLRDEFELSAIVTCVDAMHGLAQLDAHPESQRQATLADLLVITKTDLLPPSDALTARLHALNPQAPVIDATRVRSTSDLILQATRIAPGAPRWLGLDRAASARATIDEGEPPLQRRTNRPGHTADIASVATFVDHPITWSGLAAWAKLASREFGDRLLRMKGVFAVEQEARPVVLHAIAGYFHRPERLAAWPDTDHRSRIVLIARGVSEADLRRSLAALAWTGGPDGPQSLAELENTDVL